MTATEYRAHLSLWSLLAAPLLAGNDLRSMPSETAGILTNREVVAIDQDALGKQGYRVAQEGANEVWAKPLAGGAGEMRARRGGADPQDPLFACLISHPSTNRPTWTAAAGLESCPTTRCPAPSAPCYISPHEVLRQFPGCAAAPVAGARAGLHIHA